MRLAQSILEAEQRRVVKEQKLHGRAGPKALKQLKELEDERLADLAFLGRVHSGRLDDLRRINLDEKQKNYLRELLAEVWDALLILHGRST